MQRNGKRKAPRAAATATERKEIKATYRIKQKPCAVKRRRRGNGGINDGYKLAVDDAGDRVPVSGARDLYGPAARPCAGEEGAAVKVTEALLAERLTARRAVQVAAPAPPPRRRGGKRKFWTAAHTKHKIDNLIVAGKLPRCGRPQGRGGGGKG